MRYREPIWEWPSKINKAPDRSGINCWRSSRNLAKASLMGARGNQELSLNCSADFQSVKDRAGRFASSSSNLGRSCLCAVMKPVEGTIFDGFSWAAGRGQESRIYQRRSRSHAPLSCLRLLLRKTADYVASLERSAWGLWWSRFGSLSMKDFLSALTGRFIASEEFQATPRNHQKRSMQNTTVSRWSCRNRRHQVWLLYRNHGRFSLKQGVQLYVKATSRLRWIRNYEQPWVKRRTKTKLRLAVPGCHGMMTS